MDNSRVDKLEKELGASRALASERGLELVQLRRSLDSLNHELAQLRNSESFQLGNALVLATRSFRDAARLPGRLASIVARRLLELSNGRLPVDQDQDAWVERGVARWLLSVREPSTISSIVHAPINPNLVDGSSIWLSMTLELLCRHGRCLLVSPVDIVGSGVLEDALATGNLSILQPSDLKRQWGFSAAEGVAVTLAVDALLGGVRLVLARGLDTVNGLVETRQLTGRSAGYLTDFYSVSSGLRSVTQGAMEKLETAVDRLAMVVVQTSQIADEIERLTGRRIDPVCMPPLLPTTKAADGVRLPRGAVLNIGYAGKIAPDWGTIELMSWVRELRKKGWMVEVHIAAGKIDAGTEFGSKEEIVSALTSVGRLQERMSRQEAIELMGAMDFVWCYRPPALEEETLEVSTKLVEMVALGAKCICYPGSINKALLGDEYPFFVRDFNDFEAVLAMPQGVGVPVEVVRRIAREHSVDTVSAKLLPVMFPPSGSKVSGVKVLVNGHDLKFIDAYASDLKRRGALVSLDKWRWGGIQNEERSTSGLDHADVILCEWGLANAVWYADRRKVDQRLVVRIHAQEVRERARHFCERLDVDAVDKIVFVSDVVRDRALEIWSWPRSKTVVVPNYVLQEEFLPYARSRGSRVVLGLLGMVPWSKRPDRALDLLEALLDAGHDAELRIKGHRPEDLPFMQVPGRSHELEAYYALYARIQRSSRLRDRVRFGPWGHDVARWYQSIDIILSCSDSESFHYAVADGALCGCHPVLWPWNGASQVYPADWVVDGVVGAVDRVAWVGALSAEESERCAKTNRSWVLDRYGARKVFPQLDGILVGDRALT